MRSRVQGPKVLRSHGPKVLRSLVAAVCLAGGVVTAQVSVDRLRQTEREPQNWLMFSGGYSGWRHSPLKQITPANAKNLEMKWAFQADSTEKLESTPLVVDGVLYFTQPPNDIVALDARTGRIFWIYQYQVAPDARVCCGRVNRGLAILGDTLFMGTIDAHLVAVNAKSGRLIWDTRVGTAKDGYAVTMAPMVVKDKVIIGTAGGEQGIIGFVAAFNVTTGKEVWRFNTIPGPGEPGHETWAGNSWQTGGASVWVTGSYEPVVHSDPAPCFHVSPGHVSLPGSPGPGIVLKRHTSFPVVTLNAATKPMMPCSPPAVPMMTLSLTTIGAMVTA